MSEDRAISLNAVIKAVDKHTNDDGTLDDDISCILEDVPSAEPKTDVLDKIRDEIAVLDDADYDYEGYYKAVTDALKIIDKYKGESDGSDADSD